MELTYIGIGGNAEDSVSIITRAAAAIRALPATTNFAISRYYLTLPAYPFAQNHYIDAFNHYENSVTHCTHGFNHYINAVCSFNTELEVVALFNEIQKIEQRFSKPSPKKNGGEPLQLNLLLYGGHQFYENGLQVPHPEWKSRLFFLLPLLDLTDKVILDTANGLKTINLKQHIQQFPNRHPETTILLRENFYRSHLGQSGIG